MWMMISVACNTLKGMNVVPTRGIFLNEINGICQWIQLIRWTILLLFRWNTASIKLAKGWYDHCTIYCVCVQLLNYPKPRIAHNTAMTYCWEINREVISNTRRVAITCEIMSPILNNVQALLAAWTSAGAMMIRFGLHVCMGPPLEWLLNDTIVAYWIYIHQ